MTFVPHDPADERMHRKALAVLDSLDRWNNRFQGHTTQKRKHQRQAFRLLSVLVALTEKSDPNEPPAPLEVRVWSRNLSQGGVGFIYPERLPVDDITVCLNPEAESKVWMRAQIVRRRLVHENFWEYGAKFVAREA